MAFKPYNNNEKNLTCSTFSNISFSNPESNIAQTKISIGYFNKVMKISIAARNNNGSNDNFATYDNDNAVSVYVSNIKARILYLLIQKLISDPDTHNVCVELKNGLIKVSDGSEYGSSSYCISISYAGEDGSVNEIVYQTKSGFHTGAINYSDGSYQTMAFDDIEINTFMMTLDEYYKASSYAIAATVREANMYARDYEINLIKSIAEKCGVQMGSGNNNAAKFNNKTFLSNSGNNSNNVSSGSMIPKEYESSTFDDIAASMMG